MTKQTDVTVVVLTRGERPSLHEAAESVARQRFDGDVKLLFVVDAPALASPLPEVGVPTGTLQIGSRDALSLEPAERIATLRNIAVEVARSTWIAFLDDDNSWTDDHLATLLDVAASSGSRAVHSWRRLIDDAGRELAPLTFPWLPRGPEADDVFTGCVAAGILDPESAVVRDALVSIHDGRDYGMVDCGEWLLERDLYLSLRLRTSRTPEEIERRIGEDDLIRATLRQRGIEVACSRLPTVLYRVGGMSNCDTACFRHLPASANALART